MKGLVGGGVVLALVLSCHVQAQENAAPPVLTNVLQIRTLEKQKALPTNAVARIRGTVTLAVREGPSLIVQDGTNGILAWYRGPFTNIEPGTVVDLEGPVARDSYASLIRPARVTVLSCGDVPKPTPVEGSAFRQGRYFGQFVSARGIIRDMTLGRGKLTLMLHAQTSHIEVKVSVDDDFELPREWLEAEVEVRGACWGDPRGVVYGFMIYPPDLGFIRIRALGNTNIFDRPLVPLKTLFAERQGTVYRVHTRGVVVQTTPFNEATIQEGDAMGFVRPIRALRPAERVLDSIAHQTPAMEVGDIIEVSASPWRYHPRNFSLLDSEWKIVGRTNVPPPHKTRVSALMTGKYWNELVQVKARLVDLDTTLSHPYFIHRLILQADDQIFTGWLYRNDPAPLGLKRNNYVEVTGASRPQAGEFEQIHSLNLYLRSLNDVRMIPAPGFWERRDTQRTMGIVAAVALLAGVWIFWQRRQMSRLRASEGRFRALIDNSFDVTVVLDEDGYAKYVSPSGRKIFGSAGLSGKPVSIASVVHPDDLPRLMEAQRAVLKEPGASQTVSDYRILARDGTVRHAEATGTNCLHVPGVRGVVVNIRDITERKKAENEAAAREREEQRLRLALTAEKELNELKSSFISMVSHEFRTPLEVILSSSNILDRYLERLPAEKRKTQLRAIRKSVHRMNDLVEDVLLVGKFDAGRMACTPVPINLGKVCQRIVSEVESASQREGTIRLHCDDLDADAAADEGLLSHILTNLLGNGIKYSPPGGMVEFRVTRHGVDAEFVVRDHGCGIPEADRARLFTAFCRGSNVAHIPGSGLGLVIVKRCVDLHHGVIRCESEEGKGTTFTVTLPLFDGTRRFYRKPGHQPTVANAHDTHH